MDETAMLSGMDLTRFSEKDDYIKTIMERRGIESGSEESEKLVKKMRQIKIESTQRDPEQTKAIKDLQKFNEQDITVQDPKTRRDLEGRVRELGSKVEGESYAGQGILEQKSAANIQAGVYAKEKEEKPIDFQSKMDKVTGKMTDRSESSEAKDDIAMQKMMDENYDKIGTSFDKNTTATLNLTIAMASLSDALGGKSKEAIASAREAVKEEYKTLNQPSSAGNVMDSIMSDVFGSGE